MASASRNTTLLTTIQNIRKISLPYKAFNSSLIEEMGVLEQLKAFSALFKETGHTREGDILNHVAVLSTLPVELGGLGYKPDSILDTEQKDSVLFLLSAWMESLNSTDRVKSTPAHLSSRPEGRRGMTLSEKIFAAHDISGRGEVKPGDVIRVDVDWILASETAWLHMEPTYNELGDPGIFRNDRFWLAGDHIVDPRISHTPLMKNLVAASERARYNFKMTDYQGMNYTIMHTEFVRERAQPGMLVIGADSHTCSAGAVGSLSIGLGVADVLISLITGETWFKIPGSVNIRLINQPLHGIGGKDVILYILKELKRNTVAADRIVEFTGPGIKHLSCDARFAICNMTTEFGGVTGIFVPDMVTQEYIDTRKVSHNRKGDNYFYPDADAEYEFTYVIDLAKVQPFVALYPSPDNVVPVSDVISRDLDGCFIGACTTTEEDLVLAALVLKAGLERGLKPIVNGKRKLVPGSLPILRRLREQGLLDVYKEAGFEIGVPGCSYCVGMSADKAEEGEVWLSSQNRNFQNRMGKGSFGNLASAVTVAASSFTMTITSPQVLLVDIDRDWIPRLAKRPKRLSERPLKYLEPFAVERKDDTNVGSQESNSTAILEVVYRGAIQRLPDFIDTDALAPSEILMHCKTDEEYGQHCLKHTFPEFRGRAAGGQNIIVAGKAFGCGSSRECAVNALIGAGIKCVIARSFAFIYGRNQANLGLLGIVMDDEEFYRLAEDGRDISISLSERSIKLGDRQWNFNVSKMELELIASGGVTPAFRRFGHKLFEAMCSPARRPLTRDSNRNDVENEVLDCGSRAELQW